jgi:acyl-lipid omega-6 desaturase (Delta-12 desaturase)
MTQDQAETNMGLSSLLTPYVPNPFKSALQLATSMGLFVMACAAMYAALPISYPLTLVLAIPTGALLVRVFIVQHDCGHGAFFASRRANYVVGILCSLMTFTPYASWRRQHAGHHANWNNLDRRLSGVDIYSACLTVSEYRDLAPRDRVIYRLTRHPLVTHLLLPPLIFLVLYRVPFDMPLAWRGERRSVYWTDAALFALIGGLGLLLGFRQVLLVQTPVIAVGSIIGVWLFGIQHRFETALWTRQGEWDFDTAAMKGSSYLRLPKVLQWFTGNIGFHHIHHLAPRVPNYRLQECYDSLPALRAVPSLFLWSALTSVRLALWDEERGKLISIKDARVIARSD